MSPLVVMRFVKRVLKATCSEVVTRLLRNLSGWECAIAGHVPSPMFRSYYLRWMNVTFKSPLTIGQDVYISSRSAGKVRLGRGCGIGSFSRLWNYADITIGDDFLAAGGLTVNAGAHDAETLSPYSAPIRIGNRVWCGVNVTILAGVTIGDDVVIGAGSVVVKDLPSNCVAAGVPAKKIRDLNRKQFWRWSDNSIHELQRLSETSDAVG